MTTIKAGKTKVYNSYICIMKSKKDPRLKRAGVSGFNKPKRTPNHPKKSHIVVAKVGNKIKTIRFGEQGAKTAGKPKAGEGQKMKKKRASYNPNCKHLCNDSPYNPQKDNFHFSI